MFNSQDFFATEIQISFVNESTSTAPRNSSHSHSQEIVMNEVSEKGVVLEVPLNSCSIGHFLLLNFKLKKGSFQFMFESSVKVIHNEPLDNKLQEIHTEFIQFKQKDLEQFLSYFENEQNAALELFHKIKGVE